MAFLVILTDNLFYSVLWLVAIYLSTGITFILIGAEYLGLILMLVYLGAIIILFLFVVMFIDVKGLNSRIVFFPKALLFVCCVSFLVYSWTKSLFFLPYVFDLLFLPLFYASNLILQLTLSSPGLRVFGLFLFNFFSTYIFIFGIVLLIVLIAVIVVLRTEILKVGLRNKNSVPNNSDNERAYFNYF